MMKLQIDPHDPVPVYLQIVEQIRVAIARGELNPGDRLETVRLLAEQLGVNASTTAHAYQILEHEGVVQTNRRLGTRVARSPDDVVLKALRERQLHDITERAWIEALAHGFVPDEIVAAWDLQLSAWRERRRGRAIRSAPPEIAVTADERRLRFAGSHDLALDALWTRLHQAPDGYDVTASYVGSLDGLVALLHGDADLAGTHILDELTGEYNVPILQRIFPGQALHVVTLVEREQGFIVPPGNPRQLLAWADLAREGLRFANRQPGSGTRALLDHHLRRNRIYSEKLAGYDFIAPTHVAVAAAVADGKADVGLGVAAAARAYGLAFVPLAHERYDLVCLEARRHHPPLATALALLRSPEYRSVVSLMGGYDTRHMGEVVSLS